MEPDDPKATPTSITQFWMDRIIVEAAARAVVVERERIRAAVEGLDSPEHDGVLCGNCVDLAAVLDAIDPEDTRTVYSCAEVGCGRQAGHAGDHGPVMDREDTDD